MQKLTKEQAIVISGYTGFLCCNFAKFHEDVEKRMNRPVSTYEMGDPDFCVYLQKLYKDDFMEISA